MRLWNGEHRAIDAIGRLGYRAYASTLADAVIARIHQVQRIKVNLKPVEIRQHASAERPRRGERRANERDTARAQKAIRN